MNKSAQKSISIKGLILASLTILIWGITFVSTKYLSRNYSAFEILFVRFIFAYAGLWIMHPHRLKLAEKTDELLFIAAGLCGVTIYQFLENTAIHYTNASNVSIIVSIAPFFTALTAQIFLKEKHISFQFIIGFIIAIAGIVLVSFNGKAFIELNPKGDLIALGASVSWGFYSLFISMLNKRNYNILASTRHMFFWSLIFMLPLMVFGFIFKNGQTSVNFDAYINRIRWSDWKNWMNLAFLGFIASSFAFAAWNKACAELGTVKASAGIYLIPVVTIIFAFFALGENLSVMGIIGAALTILGLIISTFRKK